MHVPTQNWVQRSDKRQADRSSQKSFQNPFNDQFLNILQLQVLPNWGKKKTVGRHCSGDRCPFCCACSHEWVLFGFKSYQWIIFYISVNHLSFLPFSLPFFSFFVLLGNSFLKHSLSICDTIPCWYSLLLWTLFSLSFVNSFFSIRCSIGPNFQSSLSSLSVDILSPFIYSHVFECISKRATPTFVFPACISLCYFRWV